MKHISLFSGIGGFDLAAEWMGWENVAHCEWNEFGQKVLKYYWPKSISYGDITKTDFTKHRGAIDIVSGGFPCQPYSSAGKRKGKEDDRHLWPEMLRAIGEIQPRWVVGENVRGLTNWNGGLVFDEVQADLEAQGFEVLPFLLPACAVNAPHRRDRIWFVAYADYNSRGRTESNIEEESQYVFSRDSRFGVQRFTAYTGLNGFWKSEESTQGCDVERIGVSVDEFNSLHGSGSITHPQRIRQPGPGRTERQSGAEAIRNWKAGWTDPNGRWPTQSPVCSRDDGLSAELSGITVSKHRQESLKGYGNAVVPELVLQIFKAIEQYDFLTQTIP